MSRVHTGREEGEDEAGEFELDECWMRDENLARKGVTVKGVEEDGRKRKEENQVRSGEGVATAEGLVRRGGSSMLPRAAAGAVAAITEQKSTVPVGMRASSVPQTRKMNDTFVLNEELVSVLLEPCALRAEKSIDGAKN